MKGKLKKIRKKVGIVLSVFFFMYVPLLQVSAAEQIPTVGEKIEEMESFTSNLPEDYFERLQNTRAVLSDCIISVGFGSDGMDIEIMTGTNDIVPVVGVKDIRVEQKMWYGWKLVAVSNGAEVTDSDGIVVHVVFKGAIKDKTYRVTCVHYADLVYDDVTEYTEGYANTGEFVFTY